MKQGGLAVLPFSAWLHTPAERGRSYLCERRASRLL